MSYCVFLAVEGGTFTEVAFVSASFITQYFLQGLCEALLYLHQIKALNVIKNN